MINPELLADYISIYVNADIQNGKDITRETILAAIEAFEDGDYNGNTYQVIIH